MKIVNVPIDEIKPYKNNPRNNKEAVKFVKNSIQDFGFRQNLVLDENNVIIVGHTRYLAAKALGYKTLPCEIACDLSPEQAKAYREADNKTGEVATWNPDLLNAELNELKQSFDMSRYNFSLKDFNVLNDDKNEISEERERLYYGDAREATANAYLLHDYDPERAEGKYNMPMLKAVQHVPSRLIGFNYLLSSSEYDAGIHFYIDDYQFERIWNRPYMYIEKLKAFDCALTPDFSLYLNMPLAMKVWNIYRSRLIGQMMQDAGIIVIPTLSWAEKETFEFCFDGIERGGVVSVSTIGIKQDKEAAEIWRAGMDEAMKRLKPSAVVVYGGDIGYEFGNTKSVFISNDVIDRWKERQ